MAWEATHTLAISVGARGPAARADAIGTALLRRAVPLARFDAGRLQPLATAALVHDRGRVGLLTAAHVFDSAQTGDIAVPLPRDGRVAALRSLRVTVVTHPQSDLAVLWIDDRSFVRRLAANWEASPIQDWTMNGVSASSYVVAGYPACNARRIDGCVYSKPLILFTESVDAQRYVYARTAERIDGETIWTPELDGVSGATVWSVNDEGDDGIACVLRPAAIQVAFLHSAHLRAESMQHVGELLRSSADRRRH